MASVKVAVRVRPFNRRENDLGSACIANVDENKTQIFSYKDGTKEVVDTKEFTFDYSYWSHREEDAHFANQEQIYSDLGTDVVSNALQGYNACVFAYGQTGSGKTFTMMGTQSDPGLIPRICESLFTSMAEGRQAGTTYKVEVSYLEIYNERVKDLLREGNKSGKQAHSLRVREHPKQGPIVEGLSTQLVQHYPDIQKLMARGNSQRTTASTHMNDTSSRSHAIFTVTFIQATFTSDAPAETRSKIHLVDLAGSERADSTGATGQRLKEGAHINKSLVTLGSVISALAEKNQGKKQNAKVFVPYRDSVLTWLLKDSLGGNSKTIMIAAISPAAVNHGETLSTLRYANRAKNIINKPTINEDPNVKLIRDLRDEINKLKSLMTKDVPEQQEKDVSGSKESMADKERIAETLSQKQAKEKQLTDEWTEKWNETHNILQEQKTLGLRKAGQGVVLDSDRPHLILLDDNLLSTGVTLYHLNHGTTTIGAHTDADICLQGQGGDVMEEHCIIELNNDLGAMLTPRPDAQCWVNYNQVTNPTRLTQGCVVVVGGSHMFRYNDPQEAARLRKDIANMSHLNLNLSRLSFLSRSATDLMRSHDNLTGLDSDFDVSNLSRIPKTPAMCDNSTAVPFCEMSTQTSLQQSHSQPTTPVTGVDTPGSNLPRKSSLTLPLNNVRSSSHDPGGSGTPFGVSRSGTPGGTPVTPLRPPSIVSPADSDTFYTATSFMSPGAMSPLSPLPLDDHPQGCMPYNSELECVPEEKVIGTQTDEPSNQKHSILGRGSYLPELQEHPALANDSQSSNEDSGSTHKGTSSQGIATNLSGESDTNTASTGSGNYENNLNVPTDQDIQSSLQVGIGNGPQISPIAPLGGMGGNIPGPRGGATSTPTVPGSVATSTPKRDQFRRAPQHAVLKPRQDLFCHSANNLVPENTCGPESKPSIYGDIPRLCDKGSGSDLPRSNNTENVVGGKILPQNTTVDAYTTCDINVSDNVPQDNDNSCLHNNNGDYTNGNGQIQNNKVSQGQQCSSRVILTGELQENHSEKSNIKEHRKFSDSVVNKGDDDSSVWHSGLTGKCDSSGLISVKDNTAAAGAVLERLTAPSDQKNTSIEEQIHELAALKDHYSKLEEHLIEGSSATNTGWQHQQDNANSPQSQDSAGYSDEASGPQRPTHLPLDSNILQEERLALLIEHEVQRRVLEEVVRHEALKEASSRPHRQRGLLMSLSHDPVSAAAMFSPNDGRPYTSMSCDNDTGSELGGVIRAETMPQRPYTTSTDDLLTPASIASLPSPLVGYTDYGMACGICINIPGYKMKGTGSASHWEYEVKMAAGSDSWTVYRRYRRFRELHIYMCHKYGAPVEDLYFPPRRLFGNFSEKVVGERRVQLEVYLQQLIVTCTELEVSPLSSGPPGRDTLGAFSPFFQRGVFETAPHTTTS